MAVRWTHGQPPSVEFRKPNKGRGCQNVFHFLGLLCCGLRACCRARTGSDAAIVWQELLGEACVSCFQAEQCLLIVISYQNAGGLTCRSALRKEKGMKFLSSPRFLAVYSGVITTTF